MGGPCPVLGRSATGKQQTVIIFILSVIPVAGSDKCQAIKYLISTVPVRIDGIYGVITINRYCVLCLFREKIFSI